MCSMHLPLKKNRNTNQLLKDGVCIKQSGEDIGLSLKENAQTVFPVGDHPTII